MSRFNILILSAFICFSSHAMANVGIPMLVIFWPAMFFLLLPVILIESFVINKMLSLTVEESEKASTYSNIFSTLVGIPIAWLILLIIQVLGISFDSTFPGFFIWAQQLSPYFSDMILAVFGGGILSPAGPKPQTSFFTVAFLAVFIVSFFLASWKTEAFVVKRLYKRINPSEVNKALFYSNLFSYLFLTCSLIVAEYFKISWHIG